jgi:hypothetical protein
MNIRSLYGAGSTIIVLKELSKHKLDLVGVQEVRWDKRGTIPAGEYTFPAELIQAVGETLMSEIYKVNNSIWNREELPDQW